MAEELEAAVRRFKKAIYRAGPRRRADPSPGRSAWRAAVLSPFCHRLFTSFPSNRSRGTEMQKPIKRLLAIAALVSVGGSGYAFYNSREAEALPTLVTASVTRGAIVDA